MKMELLKSCETLPSNILDDVCLNLDCRIYPKLNDFFSRKYVRLRPPKFGYMSKIKFVCCCCLRFKDGERSHLQCKSCDKEVTICWLCEDNEYTWTHVCSWCLYLEDDSEDDDSSISN